MILILAYIEETKNTFHLRETLPRSSLVTSGRQTRYIPNNMYANVVDILYDISSNMSKRIWAVKNLENYVFSKSSFFVTFTSPISLVNRKQK